MSDASDAERDDTRHVARRLRAAEAPESTDEHMAARIAHRLFRQGEAPRLARYAVLEMLGEGAMGTVLAAYDPELDRRVALKVLRGLSEADDLQSSAHARLRKEARALAKLSHPNVVAVYEVGRCERGLYISMEYVEGVNLRHWLAERPDAAPAEILALFVAAGRGLAAAHDCGLQHRDFKPDNVLVGADGRVRVADFGLARIGDATHELSSLVTDPGAPEGATGTEPFVGTVAYMAPEQLRRLPSDARADQFAFCVSLHEALFHKRPFAATTAIGQLEAIERADLQIPHLPGVPSSVAAALRRGMSVDPDARYPGMHELLADLEPERAGRGRNGVTTAAVGLLASLSIAGGAWALSSDASPCESSPTHMLGVWDDERAGAVGAAFSATDTRHAADAWAQVRSDLDRYRDDWIEGHREACVATAVHREQSEAVLDRRMSCLQRAHDELVAVVDVLADADERVVHQSHAIVAGLPPLERCADLTALLAEVAPPADPATAAAVTAARAKLSRAAALRRAGRHADAEAVVHSVDTGIDYGPLEAELAYERAEVDRAQGRIAAARAGFETALDRGLRWGQWSLARHSAGRLAHVVGAKQAEPQAGLAYARMTLGLAMRPDAESNAEGIARHELSTVLLAAGDEEAAEAQLGEALALLAGDPTADPTQVANARHDFAVLLHRQGRYTEAREQLADALEARRRAHGSWHPQVAQAHMGLGVILKALGEHEAARREYDRALEVLTATVGAEHPSTLTTLTNLASLVAEQGHRDEADALYRSVLDVQERTLGADHLDVADTRRLVAVNLSQQGRRVEAEAAMREVLAVYEARLGADHPSTARVLGNLATILGDRGRLEESEAMQRLALERLEAKLDASDERVATARINLGDALLALGRAAEAETQYEEALASLRASLPASHPRIALAEQSLADAQARR